MKQAFLDELKKLNSAQLSAVTYEASDPLLVLAGPGSGKTHTLTKRLLYLILIQEVPADNILVLTFTKAAAMEMQTRFIKSAGDMSNYSGVQFGTFHSVFYHILKHSLGNKYSQIKLLTEEQKRRCMSAVLKKYVKVQEDNLNAVTYNLSLQVLNAISIYKNTLDKDRAVNEFPSELREHFHEIYSSYEKIKSENKELDFDDMLTNCLKLLQSNAIQRRYWQNRFPYILIDEFQDINPVQYEIIRLLAKKSHIFAVGDDDQSIYGFRGATPECMKRFEREFHARTILLNINYRSTDSIVRYTGTVIKENENRYEKEFIANRHEAGEEYKLLQEFADWNSQKLVLISQIHEIPVSESIAILFRTNSQMQRMASSLRMKDISFRMNEKEQNLMEHFVVKDVISYLRVFQNTNDSEAIKQIINKPARYITRDACEKNKTLDALIDYYRKQTDNVSQRETQVRKITDLTRLKTQAKSMKNKPLYLQIQYMRKVIGYDAYLETLAQKICGHYEEWKELLLWLTEEAKNYNSLEEWLKSLKDGLVLSKKSEDSTSNLFLMTVHASKGLEFDHVFIPDCNERVFPYGSLLDKETVEEERRIFYVAMTRAKKSLRLMYLTGTSQNPRQPSRFIHQLIHQTRNCQDTHQKHLQPSHIPRHPQYNQAQAPR